MVCFNCHFEVRTMKAVFNALDVSSLFCHYYVAMSLYVRASFTIAWKSLCIPELQTAFVKVAATSLYHLVQSFQCRGVVHGCWNTDHASLPSASHGTEKQKLSQSPPTMLSCAPKDQVVCSSTRYLDVALTARTPAQHPACSPYTSRTR